MIEDAEPNYADLKKFMGFYVEHFFDVTNLPPDKQPIASLEGLERRSMKIAMKGLRQAINDCIEMSLHFDPPTVTVNVLPVSFEVSALLRFLNCDGGTRKTMPKSRNVVGSRAKRNTTLRATCSMMRLKKRLKKSKCSKE
jgi:hypothetical protein